MKILFVHLSDLHIEKFNDELEKRATGLLDTLDSELKSANKIIVIVSGDIAAYGRSDEYQEVSKFMKQIKDTISLNFNKLIEFIFVPGNHDCCFDNVDELKHREDLINDAVGSGKIQPSVVNYACKIQKNYADFVSDFSSEPISKQNLYSIHQCLVDEFCINFFCFNTAWMSMNNEEKYEQPGKMYMPMNMIGATSFTGVSNLNIAVFHHPNLWRNPTNSQEFHKLIERTSDLVFIGHSHQQENNLVDDLEHNKTVYINAGLFNDVKKPNICQFKTISYDSSSNKAQISPYSWENGSFKKGDVPREFKIKHKINKKRFKLNEGTEAEWIDNLEIPILHSGKNKLLLSDIFVFPQVINLDEISGKGDTLVLPQNSEKVLFAKNDNIKILVLGNRKYGKTGLLKVMFKRFYENDKLVPIYIHGNSIKSSSIERFIKTVNSSFVEQYSKDQLAKFHKLENKNKLILIDDYDKCKLNSKNSKALFASITRHYPNVIVTASNVFEINEFITNDNEENPIDAYDKYQLTQFDNVHIRQLITNWYSLYEDYEEKEQLIEIDNAKKIIDITFGNRYVNKTPFFILTILQNIQLSDPEQLLFSSFGHYYEVIFRKAIGRFVNTNDNIDALFQFLPELAYFCFTNQVRKLTRSEFEEFQEWYCREYKISPNMKLIFDSHTLISTLVDASMLVVDKGIVKFAQRYVYYFFLGRYLASNLEDESIRIVVSNICKRLYRDEFANIILFLVHHTRNEFVLNELLLNSKNIFEGIAPINLDNDIDGINKLMDEIPELVLAERNYRKNRIRIDEQIDKDEVLEKDLDELLDINVLEEDILDPNEEIMELDLVAQIGLSLRLIEILGLVLKNHHSSLKGDIKYSVGTEAYELGLRTIKPVYSLFENNKKLVVKNITSLINHHGFINESKIKKESEKHLFLLCFIFAYVFIKFIAESVGNINLSETFKDIKENNPQLSFELVDIAIKLDCSNGFSTPMEELEQLANKLIRREKTNKGGEYVEKRIIRSMLPYHILVQLVQDSTNLYPPDDTTRKKLASLFDTSMHDQNILKLAYFKKK